jgi:hypothetical protein
VTKEAQHIAQCVPVRVVQNQLNIPKSLEIANSFAHFLPRAGEISLTREMQPHGFDSAISLTQSEEEIIIGRLRQPSNYQMVGTHVPKDFDRVDRFHRVLFSRAIAIAIAIAYLSYTSMDSCHLPLVVRTSNLTEITSMMDGHHGID